MLPTETKNENDIGKTIYISKEPIYHEKYLRYPLNALSSYFYLLPIYFIDNKYKYINLYGCLILFLLSNISFFGWALSLESIKYWHTNFILITLLWILTVIIDYPELNIVSIFLINIDKDNIVLLYLLLFSTLILMFNPNIIATYLYLLSVFINFMDTFYGYSYGTAIFHLVSSFSIIYYFMLK